MSRITERYELLDVRLEDAVDPRLSVDVPLEVLARVSTIDRDSIGTIHYVLLLGQHHLLDPIKAACCVAGQVGRLQQQCDSLLLQVLWRVRDAGEQLV